MINRRASWWRDSAGVDDVPSSPTRARFSLVVGIGDSLDAIRRQLPAYVGLALVLATARIGLYARQLAWLSRRSLPLTSGTAVGLALVAYGSPQ